MKKVFIPFEFELTSNSEGLFLKPSKKRKKQDFDIFDFGGL